MAFLCEQRCFDLLPTSFGKSSFKHCRALLWGAHMSFMLRSNKYDWPVW